MCIENKNYYLLDNNNFISLFYKHKDFINEKNLKGESIIHLCSLYGQTEKLMILYNIFGLDVFKEKTINKSGALFYASYGSNDTFLVSWLIKIGLSPMEQNKDGAYPFFYSSNVEILTFYKWWFERNKIKMEKLKDNLGNNFVVYQNYLANKNNKDNINMFF